MTQHGELIRKTYYAIMIVNVISMVTGVASVMIDAIIIGQFLGTDAVTAIGMVNPVVMVISFFGAVFSSGLGIVCSRYMGMAKTERVEQIFTLGMTTLLALGIILSAALYFTASVIAQALTHNSVNEQTADMIEEYLKAYSFGITSQYMFMTLASLMMLDNDKKRSLIGMFCNLGGNIIFDLLNVLIFRKGMWGMAMATVLSYTIGMTVLLLHFTRKQRILRLTRNFRSGKDLKEIILCGMPAGITLASKAVQTMVFNALLLNIAGEIAVTAFSAYTSLFAPITYIVRGMVMTVSTMCSLLYGEEDRSGLLKAFSVSMRSVIVILGIMSAVLFILACPAAGLFLDTSAEEALSQAEQFIRFAAVQLVLMSASFTLSGALQGLRHIKMNYILDLLRECFLPVICAAALGTSFGMSGFEISFILSGALVLIFVFILPSAGNRKLSYKAADLMMLSEKFGSEPDDTFEATARTMQDVAEISDSIMGFCRKKGTDQRTAAFMSLFVEEMAGNAVNHGFTGKKEGYIDIRYVYSPERQVIRFRDNGKPFDPIEWLRRNHPDDPLSGAGIRIIVGLAKDAKYIPALGLNNLMIVL